MDRPNKRSTKMVAVVLLLLMLATDMSTIGIASVAVHGPMAGPRTVQDQMNDPVSKSIGAPSYFASFLSMAGFGTPTGHTQELLRLDLDGDGISELATLTAQGFVEVMEPPSYKVIWRSPQLPGGAHAIASGDIDNDSHPELIVGDGQGNVYVYSGANIKDPRMPPLATGNLTGGYSIRALAMVDYNDDGRPDILCAPAINGRVNLTYLVNTPGKNGKGIALSPGLTMDLSFQLGYNYHIEAIRIANITKSGNERLYIALDNGPYNELPVIWLDKQTLDINETYMGYGFSVMGLEIADIDNDSYKEIVISTGYEIDVINPMSMVLKWQIAGSNLYYRSMTVGNLSGKGCEDILDIEQDRHSLEMFLAEYNGSSRTNTFKEHLGWGQELVGMAVGDMVQGRSQIIMSTSKNLTIMRLAPSGTHNYTIDQVVLDVGFEAYGLDGLDWNGDGITELMSGSNQGLLSVIDPSTGNILAQRSTDYSQATVIVSDLNNDGQPEILTGNLKNVTELYKNLTVKAYANLNTHESYSWTPQTRAPMAVADIDWDGRPEVLVGTESPTIEVLNGNNLTTKQEYWGSSGRYRAILTVDSLYGDGHPAVVVGDSYGSIYAMEGKDLHNVASAYISFSPYGLAAADVNGDGKQEIIVGDFNGVVRAVDPHNMTPIMASPDLGDQAWGITVADVDGDGHKEVVVGTGDGMLYALNMTDLTVEWKAYLGEWIGPYDSILVKDLDHDGHIEVAVGSDGFVYVVRLLLPSEKPDLIIGDISVPPVMEDGRIVNISVPVTLTGPVPGLNVTVDFSIEPSGANVLGGQDLGRVSAWLTKGTHSITITWGAIAGTWKLTATVDPDNIYSENDEWNDRALLMVNVTQKFASLEWFAGQGTVLGRYNGMVMADMKDDGRTSLLVGATEGFVQSYIVKKLPDGSDVLMGTNATEDLGSNPYGVSVADINGDGAKELVVSTGEGWVYSFKGMGERLEWKAHVVNGSCYGMTTGDIDSDGNTEVVVGCSNSRLYVLNGADGRLKEQALLLFELYAMTLVDMGKDGKLDLVVASQDGTIYVLNAKTLALEQSLDPGDALVDSIRAGDIDRDGRNEIVFGDRLGHLFVLGSVQNTSSSLGWNLTEKTNVSTGSAVMSVELADISDDPGQELIVGCDDGLRAYRSRSGMLELIGNRSIPGGLTGMAVGDLDRDGGLEVAVGTLRGNLTVLGINATYMGSATNISFTVEASLAGLGAGLYGTAYGDIDVDGAPEIMLGTDSGELRVYDGISKEFKAHFTGLGSSLYGIKVADVNDDGLPELVVGSGNKTVCALRYSQGSMDKLWCSDNLGDWTIGFDVLDLNHDGKHEVVVASGSRVYVLDGTTGKVMKFSDNIGTHIVSLAAGRLNGTSSNFIVVGTEQGNLTVLFGNNLSMAWCVTLDSWPVGLAIADIKSDGEGIIYAGTNTAVYALSYNDKEILWKHVVGQNAWGLTVADFESNGNYDVFAGLKDGRLMALNATTGRMFWTSTYLGSRAGWYNSLNVGDVDLDLQNELIVGSSGFLYLFGAGNVRPRPMVDAVLEKVSLQDTVLADGQKTNITATVYDHSLAPLVNLTVHLFVDDGFMDSMVIPYLEPLGRTTVKFPYTARVGSHNLSVYVDKYNTIHEYNEKNNEMTISVDVLGSMNLAIFGGANGVRFSDTPIKGVPVTVFADIRNTGEELSSGHVKFYWANLKLFGESTVQVRGQEMVTAAVNWTPSDAGDWDVTVVIEPDGFDSNSADNIAHRVVHVRTHPSVALATVQMPHDLVEGTEYKVPVNITNRGEAGTSGELMAYIDGRLSWRSGRFIIPGGGTVVQALFNSSDGKHTARFALENISLDDKTTDDSISVNVTVHLRPDMLFDTVTPPTDDMLVPGRQLFIALLVANHGGSNGTCVIRGYDNDAIFFEMTVSIAAGSSRTIQVPWNVTKGDHALVFRIEGTVPIEIKTGNNMAHVNLFVPEKKTVGTNWPMISVVVIGILAPVIAALIYYSQVQPVREAARKAEEAQRPVKRAINRRKSKGG